MKKYSRDLSTTLKVTFYLNVILTKRSAWKDLGLNVLSGVSPDIKPCCYYEKI